VRFRSDIVATILDHDWFPRPVPANVLLGARSWLYSSFAFIHYQSRRPCGVRVGHDSGLYDSTFFELGPSGEVEIGNYCTVVGAIFACNSRVVIEDYALIAHDVVLADTPAAVPPDHHVREADPPAPATTIVIGENSWIGARVVLLAGARIGTGAIIGAGTVVDFDVDPYAILAGNPARVVGWARPRGSSVS
jgi:acetyltransferase-like isoleucine patch superfamily enzyme